MADVKRWHKRRAGNKLWHDTTLGSRPVEWTVPYWYLIDPVLGWMRVRIQTWTSHSTQIYVNGRDCVGKRRKTGLLSGAATTGEISQTTPAMTSA